MSFYPLLYKKRRKKNRDQNCRWNFIGDYSWVGCEILFGEIGV